MPESRNGEEKCCPVLDCNDGWVCTGWDGKEPTYDPCVLCNGPAPSAGRVTEPSEEAIRAGNRALAAERDRLRKALKSGGDEAFIEEEAALPPLIRGEPMSDSSSVDRWHPSNVEWPEQIDGTRNRSKGPTNPAYLLGYYHPQAGPEVVPLAAYEALFADRGRVLAAARELADAVENFGGADTLEEATDAYDLKVMPALASFREVDQ